MADTNDTATGADTEQSPPLYSVTAEQQGSGWMLNADLPGYSFTHCVRSLKDMEWVAREMRTVVASHVGVPEHDFGPRFQMRLPTS